MVNTGEEYEGVHCILLQFFSSVKLKKMFKKAQPPEAILEYQERALSMSIIWESQ